MNTNNKSTRQKFKVIKKPHQSFIYEVGDVIEKPHNAKVLEWVNDGKLYTCEFKLLTEYGYLEDITNYPEPSLESIVNDYEKYGYLEDYQVEWLMCVANDYKLLLELLKEKILTIPDFWGEDLRDITIEDPIFIEFSNENIKTLFSEIQKLRGSQHEG